MKSEVMHITRDGETTSTKTTEITIELTTEEFAMLYVLYHDGLGGRANVRQAIADEFNAIRSRLSRDDKRRLAEALNDDGSWNSHRVEAAFKS